MLDPVGTADDDRHWHVSDRHRLRITRQDRCVDRLAGAVGSTIRGQEHINWSRSRAALDTAIRQIEPAFGQIKKREIAYPYLRL